MNQARGNALDERDLALWRFIAEFIEQYGYAPTFRQMEDAVEGTYLSGMTEQLDRLVRAKVIKRLVNESNTRAIKLLKAPPPRLYNVFETIPGWKRQLWTPEPMQRGDARAFIGSRLKPYFESSVVFYEDASGVSVCSEAGLVTRFDIEAVAIA